MAKIIGVYGTPTVTRITDNVTTNGTTITVAGTYTPPKNCVRLKIRMVGGGGGGAGGKYNTTTEVVGSAGTNTTFGSSLLIAGGGSGGTASTIGATGGTYTINSPAIGFGLVGGYGNPGVVGTGGLIYGVAGNGGSTIFGGSGQGNSNASNGIAGVPNTGGGGGGGGGSQNATRGGAGGGSGGYVDAIITSPNATYSYTVGSGGSGGVSDTTGGAGGSGVIIIEEFYI